MSSAGLRETQVRWLGVVLFTASAALAGCTPDSLDDLSVGGDSTTEAISSVNGLTMINGLTMTNGLNSLNGLSTVTGLGSVAGLANGVGLMTSSSGRTTLAYLVRCALPAGRSIMKKDQNWVSYAFAGQIGVAPEWETGACGSTCQEQVSACLLAHVNTTGQHISLWLDGDSPAIGWGQSVSFPFQEGSFFGNLFSSPPHAYFCNGKDFDRGVVPGRLGATQVGAPYINGLATFNGIGDVSALCHSGTWWDCATAASPHDKDGFSQCSTYTHVVTVWRNFDPTTLYKISNKLSGKVLDGGAKQTRYVGSTSQKWKITQVAPQQYSVINTASGQSLDSGGTLVVTSPPTGGPNQLFSFTPLGDGTGYSKITPASNTNASLSPALGSFTVEGAPIQKRSWTGSDEQQWQVLLAN